VGKPELARKSLVFVIPPDAAVKGVEVVRSDRVRVEGRFKILPVQYPEPFLIGYQPPGFVEPDEVVYGTSAEYPGVIAEVVHTGTKSGFRLVTVVVYPLQYLPTRGELYLYRELRLRLVYEEGVVVPEAIWLHRLDGERAAVKRLVVNPDDVERWTPPLKVVDRYELDDTTFVNPEFAIMTPDAYLNDLKPLRDWKCRKGVPTEIFTLTWIRNNYPGANDTVKVRNFIQDYNQNHGTDYFLCVGDWGVFPMKRVSTIDDANTPSDFWYGDYDDDDYTEAYLGRFSISNAAELNTHITKTLKYERESPSSGFHEKIFMPAYVLWSGYGCPVNDTIALHDPPFWHDAKRYDWVSALRTREISDSFNVGFGYTNISAHGIEYGWGTTFTIYHDNDDADALNNTPPKTGVITGICCLIGALDYSSDDCYVEHMMNNPNGGAAAFWGNTRHGYGRIDSAGRSEWQCIWFYDELTNNGIYNIGKTVGAVNDRCAPHTATDPYVYHCMRNCLLFGDPQMELWTRFPITLYVSHKSSVPVGPSTFSVTVTDSKAPVANARVCLMCKQDPEYQVGYTNSSGIVSFNIDPEVEGDTMWVTVTKHNYRPYEGYAIVSGIGVAESSGSNFKPDLFVNTPTTSPVTIGLILPDGGEVTLSVYNVMGQEVAQLLKGVLPAGKHEVIWKSKLSAGVYLVRLNMSDGKSIVHKFVLVE